MFDLPPERFASALAEDGEFRRAIRLWTGSMAFSDGERHLLVRVADGVLAGVVAGAGVPEANVLFVGPAEGWRQVLAPVPPPYYQDLLGGAAGHHGFLPGGDLDTLCQYYPAVVRAVAIAGELSREAR